MHLHSQIYFNLNRFSFELRLIILDINGNCGTITDKIKSFWLFQFEFFVNYNLTKMHEAKIIRP